MSKLPIAKVDEERLLNAAAEDNEIKGGAVQKMHLSRSLQDNKISKVSNTARASHNHSIMVHDQDVSKPRRILDDYTPSPFVGASGSTSARK